MNERAFINWLSTSGADAQALQDDAFYDPKTRHLYTSDILVDGRHFSRAYCSPQDIGWKAAAVNLSDIAAMGGVPLYLLVSIVIPKMLEFSWLKELYEGLYSACDAFNARIVGGDTVGGDVFTINVTAVGICQEDVQPAHRWLAKEGDVLLTTGAHGLSQVGLLSLQAHEEGYPASQQAHKRPQPQLTAGLALCQSISRVAMMDTSDGLADALFKLAQASQQHLVVNVEQLTLDPEVTAYAQSHDLNPLSMSLYGGEDFQLLASVSPEAWKTCPPDVQALFQSIGHVLSADSLPYEQSSCQPYGAWLLEADKKALISLKMEKTFQHF